MLSNTIGWSNTANGALALLSNTNGIANTAVGYSALFSNTVGLGNTAVGWEALPSNTTGDANKAIGSQALEFNSTGGGNTGVGDSALYHNRSGIRNIALGFHAGDLTTGSDNIDIGYIGVEGESSTIRIGTQGTQTAIYVAGIHGATATNGLAVFVDMNGKLDTMTSSARFKEDIKPMDNTSESIFALKPVRFRYKNHIDHKATPQFGLIAEEVEAINPDLVVRDKEGKAYSVRYDQVNAMLLNEFLKEHHQVQEQGRKLEAQDRQIQEQRAMIAKQQEQIEALTAGLQKVSAQLEAGKPAPQVVNNP